MSHDRPKGNGYDLSSGDRIREIILALRKRLPPGMNPYTGLPLKKEKRRAK
jgi:hypothetical protein